MKLDVISTEAAPKFDALAQAVRIGQLLFVSGQVGAEPASKRFAGPDIEAQTRLVMENLQAVLKAGGSRLESVIKVTAFLCDMKDFEVFNRVYLSYFKDHRPARSTVQVAGLVPPYTVEVEAVAVVDNA